MTRQDFRDQLTAVKTRVIANESVRFADVAELVDILLEADAAANGETISLDVTTIGDEKPKSVDVDPTTLGGDPSRAE